MSDIFISYARKDRETAQRLAKALEAQGWSVWWDKRLRAGEVFDEVIERELAAARCVIVLWSKISVQSGWVREEARKGLERRILVPLRIENVQLPLPFGGIQTVDLIGWKSQRGHSGFKQLMADVAGIIGPPPSPLPSPDGNGKDSTSFLRSSWPRWLEHSVATIKRYFAVIARWRPSKGHLAITGGIALLVVGGILYTLYPHDELQDKPAGKPPEVACHDQELVNSLLRRMEKIGEAYKKNSIDSVDWYEQQENIINSLENEVNKGLGTEACYYEMLERLKRIYEKGYIHSVGLERGQQILLKGIAQLPFNNNPSR